MQKTAITAEQLIEEKEAILHHLEGAKTIGEWAKRCDLSITTLYKLLDLHGIDYRFKAGRKVGGRKIVTK